MKSLILSVISLIISVICVLPLTGCGSDDVTAKHIEKAEKVCENNGGFKHLIIYGFPSRNTDVYCRNGSTFTLSMSLNVYGDETKNAAENQKPFTMPTN